MKVAFTRRARLDLIEIADNISRHNPGRAFSFVEELEVHCKSLTEFPLKHAILPEHQQSGIRRAVHGNYNIFYITNDQVTVLRVLHGAIDYERILFPDE